jgi:hypothetical protein
MLGVLGSGPGQDGFVMQSDRATAVKFFDRIERFQRELQVYQLLEAVHVAEMFRRATGFTLMDLHPGNIAFSD